MADEIRSKLLEEFNFKEEKKEILTQHVEPTGFPDPIKSYRLTMELADLSLEEPYFWTLDQLRDFLPITEKLEDSFAAAENSAFFGSSQQRLGLQQDKVSQFLATIGKMVRELFQLVRELRILDERLSYYYDSFTTSRSHESAEITLKGIFVDLVQGGGKSAASVYGMARELEFITLPDLFFDAPPFKNQVELENHIKGLRKDFNENVLRVLIRHLTQYFRWKEQTMKEHVNRRRFMLTYLLQHFEIIKMYVVWIKPYLKHTQKLTLKGTRMDTADIVSAFEGSMLDVEILARKSKDGANGCILATFTYRTRAEMKVQQEGYQRGPVHIGKFEMNLRVYGWTDQEVERYRKLKNKEILEFMGDISSTVLGAMTSLGKELDTYLEEARESVGEEFKKKEEKEEEKPDKKSLGEKLFADFYTPKKKKAEKGPTAKELKRQEAKQKEAMPDLVKHAKLAAWNTYNNFKKAHFMISW